MGRAPSPTIIIIDRPTALWVFVNPHYPYRILPLSAAFFAFPLTTATKIDAIEHFSRHHVTFENAACSNGNLQRTRIFWSRLVGLDQRFERWSFAFGFDRSALHAECSVDNSTVRTVVPSLRVGCFYRAATFSFLLICHTLPAASSQANHYAARLPVVLAR